MVEVPLESMTVDAVRLACEETVRIDPRFRTGESGRAAFRTWCVARMAGWDCARSAVSRNSWFRHLRILKAVGIPVPVGDLEQGTRAKQEPEPGWFGVTGAQERAVVLAQHPGRIMELVNRKFRVVRPWTYPLEVADCWPVGTKGVLVRLGFSCSTWDVQLEHSNWDLPPDFRWPEIRLNDFLHWTVPLEASA